MSYQRFKDNTFWYAITIHWYYISLTSSGPDIRMCYACLENIQNTKIANLHLAESISVVTFSIIVN